MTAKILLAEDDNDMRRFLVKALEKAGYKVLSYDNGASAYDRLREEPFSLLLTDIVMPEMDGIELARRATELDPDLKVMFITGFAAVALNPDSRRRKTPRSFPSPSTCATSSTRSTRCWPPEQRTYVRRSFPAHPSPKAKGSFRASIASKPPSIISIDGGFVISTP